VGLPDQWRSEDLLFPVRLPAYGRLPTCFQFASDDHIPVFWALHLSGHAWLLSCRLPTEPSAAVRTASSDQWVAVRRRRDGQPATGGARVARAGLGYRACLAGQGRGSDLPGRRPVTTMRLRWGLGPPSWPGTGTANQKRLPWASGLPARTPSGPWPGSRHGWVVCVTRWLPRRTGGWRASGRGTRPWWPRPGPRRSRSR